MRDRGGGLVQVHKATQREVTHRVSHPHSITPGLSRLYDKKVSEQWLRIESISLEKEEARGETLNKRGV